MQFHVTIKVHDTIVLEGDKLVRQAIGEGLERLMGSGKVHASGLLGGVRGGFFVLDIDAPEGLYELLGPEIYGTCAVEAHPVVPVEKAGEIFRKWAEEGR
jgi:hypothetical protein